MSRGCLTNERDFPYSSRDVVDQAAHGLPSDRLLVAGMQSNRGKLAADLFLDEPLKGTFAQHPRAVIALDGLDRLLRQRDHQMVHITIHSQSSRRDPELVVPVNQSFGSRIGARRNLHVCADSDDVTEFQRHGDSFSGSEQQRGRRNVQAVLRRLPDQLQPSRLALHAGYVDRLVCSQTRNASRTNRKGEGIDIDMIALKDQRQIPLVVMRNWKGHADADMAVADYVFPQLEPSVNDLPKETLFDATLEERIVIDQDRRALTFRQIRSQVPT